MGHPSSEGLGGRIKAIREAKGMTQLAFAAWLTEQGLPVSQSVYSRWESGAYTPSFEALAGLARLDPEGRGRLWLVWGDDVREGRAFTPSAVPGGPVERVEDAVPDVPPPARRGTRRRA